jgi:acyl-CoA oxidase
MPSFTAKGAPGPLSASVPRHAAAAGTHVHSAALSPATLGLLLQPTHRELRARLLELFREDVFRPRYGETVATERKRTLARIARLRETGVFHGTVAADPRDTVEANLRYECIMACIALLDHSLEIKLGVSFGLFGATVKGLGNEEQGRQFLPGIESMEEFGCFALTELGHGSNARGIETTAAYDPATETFDLHTPTESAQKYWIGGAAESATLATVFAHLYVNGENVGVHAFVVRMRELPGGKTLPGIQTEDCGVKDGLNGVDNGRIWFDHCKVPRENLLRRTCAITADGKYTSNYKTPDARFGAALAALTGGRVGIGSNAVNAAKTGLCIAVKYTSARRAFAPSPGEQEVPLLAYTSIQRRLMIPLATSYVYSLCAEDLRQMWEDCLVTKKVTKEVHVLSSGFKAQFTWFMADALQHARECCGGQGYKSENRIGLMRADRDVSLTFEGANDVMMQQVAKELLAEYSRVGKVLHADTISADGITDLGVDAANDSSVSVTDGSFFYTVLRDREAKLIRMLAGEMARRVKVEGLSPFDAWNMCLGLAAEAASAHMDRRVFDMHHTLHVPRAAALGEEVEAAVRLCGELFFLHSLDRDGTSVRLQSLSPPKAADVHAAVQTLCAKVAEIAGTLVDGFELPAHLLAPIAFDFVAHNSRARM